MSVPQTCSTLWPLGYQHSAPQEERRGACFMFAYGRASIIIGPKFTLGGGGGLGTGRIGSWAVMDGLKGARVESTRPGGFKEGGGGH